LRIHGQLPAAIVNGADSFWKWPDFQLDLDFVSGHTAYHRASRSFIEIEETFCGQMDVRMYVHTYAQTDSSEMTYIYVPLASSHSVLLSYVHPSVHKKFL